MQFAGPLSDSQLELLQTLNLISSSLSLIGELFIFYIFYKNPKMRSLSFKLIFCLSFGDFLYSIANFLSIFRYIPISCVIEGFIRETAFLMCSLWVPIILIITWKQVRSFNPRMWEYFGKILTSVIVISLIPSIVTLISELFGGWMYFGIDLVFCETQPDEATAIFVAVPNLLSVILSIVLSLGIYCEMKRRGSQKNEEYISLFIYPLTMTILYLPTSFDCVMGWIYGGDFFFVIVLHVTTSRLGGFANMMIYGKRTIKLVLKQEEKKKKPMDGTDGLGSMIGERNESVVPFDVSQGHTESRNMSVL